MPRLFAWLSSALAVHPAVEQPILRFSITSWVGALVSSVFLMPLYVRAGLFGSAIGAVVLVGVGAVVLVQALRGRISLATHSHLAALLSLVTTTFACLTERPIDPMAVAYLSVVPLAVMLAQGQRAAFAWMLPTVGVALALIATRSFDVQPAWLPTAGWAVQGVRLMALMLSLIGFANAFDESRQRALEAERQANAAKTRFLANMSHELRTPMNALLGLTEVLLHSRLEAEHREHLEVVHNSGQGMLALLNDLLDLSKIDAGKLVVERVDFEFPALVDELRRLHEPAAVERGLALRLEVEAAVPHVVRGDPLRLRQVISNLVSNAVKFTPPGGQVVLRCQVDALTAEAVRLRVSVEDSGIGISPEALSQLFQPFQQANESISRQFGGTGLGLALCHQLVQALGGALSVTSTVGVGSTFSFTVPLTRAKEASVARVTQQLVESKAPLDTPPVLVVDDNPINLRVATALIERCGYPVRAVASATEALELLPTTTFLAVLIDCHMPHVDGFEATRRIRQLSGALGQLPVVALTASTLPEDVKACRDAGMNGYLAKPASSSALAYTLERLRRGEPLGTFEAMVEPVRANEAAAPAGQDGA